MSWMPTMQRRRNFARAAPPSAPSDVPLDPLTRFIQFGLLVVPSASTIRGGSCSCDRMGCPSPGAHPLSRAWQSEASADADRVARWRVQHPEANYVSPTGRTHDVLDVPADAGAAALERLLTAGTVLGPVAVADDRYLFFTAPRTSLDDADDEWWSCDLDCRPENVAEHPGLRWHDRGSYVPVPPSLLPSGRAAQWAHWPEDTEDGATTLPDSLVVLDVLADELADTEPVAAH